MENRKYGVPFVAQQKWIWLASKGTQVQSLALLSGLRIWHCCERWCWSHTRLGSDMLWPWRRLAAVAPFPCLTWNPPYAEAAALKSKKKKIWEPFWKWEPQGNEKSGKQKNWCCHQIGISIWECGCQRTELVWGYDDEDWMIGVMQVQVSRCRWERAAPL